MSKWLREFYVGFEGRFPPFPAPTEGGFYSCACFTETYCSVTSQLLRTRNTAKVLVWLDVTHSEPWASTETPRDPVVTLIRWPFDVARLKSAAIDDWIRIHFEEMHAANLYLAKIRGWPAVPFEAARQAVLDSNFHFTGFHGRHLSSPDRRHRIGLLYDMDWRWLSIQTVLTDRNYQELGRKEIVRYPAGEAPIHRFLRGKSGWASNTRFMFTNSDRWLEPRHASINLSDFTREA